MTIGELNQIEILNKEDLFFDIVDNSSISAWTYVFVFLKF